MQTFFLIFLGLITGILGGMFGIGGGSIMIPALVIFLGMTQHQAQGTSLAVMLLPVFVLSVLRYHQAGNVNFKVAFLIAIGFAVGALLGANAIQGISDANMKKMFGIFLMIMGIKVAFF
ncbi:MAG: sulfite exporter TauE/SafE family protein [Candidatus Omnitrophica bacterium]|nr:sulfite exporter TauE/SafE family protein [Candidatus Omnitrophota bacterium]